MTSSTSLKVKTRTLQFGSSHVSLLMKAQSQNSIPTGRVPRTMSWLNGKTDLSPLNPWGLWQPMTQSHAQYMRNRTTYWKVMDGNGLRASPKGRRSSCAWQIRPSSNPFEQLRNSSTALRYRGISIMQSDSKANMATRNGKSPPSLNSPNLMIMIPLPITAKEENHRPMNTRRFAYTWCMT
jgi:hypothetical protein